LLSYLPAVLLTRRGAVYVSTYGSRSYRRHMFKQLSKELV